MKELDKEKRLKLGILFNFSPKWMGGIVYIQNLIKTLSFLADKYKPEIFVFYKPDLKKYIELINYPYLRLVEWHFSSVYEGYLKSLILHKNIFVDEILKNYNLDVLYPLPDFPVKTGTKTKLISWYADMQHKYYPEFFTWRKILERNTRIRFMLNNSNDLVVSSQSVADDFKRFFRMRDGMKIHIFHFASVIDDFSELDINTVRAKYKLPGKYFMVSNQFHRHKNHIILFKAILRLKEKHPEIHLALTGRFPDASNSPYMQELHSIINNNQLQSQITLLGVIPRNEQLLLMKYSQAVLQPSLFEGWSTVIEDAISLQVPVIASSLPVNIEQLGPDGNYFEPHDDFRLAEIMSDFPSRNMEDKFYEDYNERIRNTAHLLINILQT